MVGWLVGWLVDCLFDWLIDSLRLVDWLVGWLVGSLRLVGCSGCIWLHMVAGGCRWLQATPSTPPTTPATSAMLVMTNYRICLHDAAGDTVLTLFPCSVPPVLVCGHMESTVDDP